MKPKRDSPVGTEFTIGRLRVNDFKQALIKLLAAYRGQKEALTYPVETSLILDLYKGQKEATLGFIKPVTFELIYCFDDSGSDDYQLVISRKDGYSILKMLKTLPLFDQWVEIRKATWSITIWFDKDEYYNFEAVRAGTNHIRAAMRKYFPAAAPVETIEEIDTTLLTQEVFYS